MSDRTVENPVTGERATYVETSRETDGARTIMDFEVAAGGGVPVHRHATHQEQIDVLDGEIEVTAGGVSRRYASGDRVVLPPQTVHAWRVPSSGKLRARVTYTPGHPGFEQFFRVWCGLARDGAVRPSGLPRRLADLALLGALDPSLLSGPLRLLAPLLRWTARRERDRKRAAALMRRYGCDQRQVDISA